MAYDSTLPHMRRALNIAALVVSLSSVGGPRASEAQDTTRAVSAAPSAMSKGSSLSGVQVRLTSPAIISGTLHATTDAKGQIKFLALAPGVYTIELTKQWICALSVERHSGDHREDNQP